MELVLGTLSLRPYVFAFVAAFLAAGAIDLGWRRTLGFAACVWPVAWLAEFSSTRVGVPFGLYHYTGATRGQELYLADAPLMDSLSFTFLAYASFCLARAVLGSYAPSRGGLALASGFLMMLLDVVIDPVALRGDRWFLGPVFYYASDGVYFGVPLSNFVGWVIVGTLGVACWLACWGGAREPGSGRRSGVREAGTGRGWAGLGARGSVRVSALGARVWPGVALYYGVLGFNLAVTAWIGEPVLLAAGATLHAALALLLRLVSRRPARSTGLEGERVQRA